MSISAPQKKKVFVGLSGGVDSSVSAALLKEAGYDVTGVFIKVWQPDFLECTWKEDRLDAMRIAATLNIPFVTLDLEKEYKQGVIDYMIAEYKTGRTPNPDVMCNKEVKFGGFLQFALAHGANYVATGHYAQIEGTQDGLVLKKSTDNEKDQSYFLWTIPQEQLGHILFPVGAMTKSEVRAYAEKKGLITATKKDSQGLCFVGKLDIKDFLKEYIAPHTGSVVTLSGDVVGSHDGVEFFTLGERHGFTITKKTPNDKPYYVVDKDIHKNTLIVSTQSPHIQKKGTTKIHLTDSNWFQEIRNDLVYHARVRYRQVLKECTITLTGEKTATIDFKVSEDAATAGQSCVIYDTYGRVVGGGIIV